MRYVRVIWRDGAVALPVEVYSEVDAEGWERRKVERFRGGRVAWADATSTNRKTGTTLSEARIPSLDEINVTAEVEATLISPQEFESVWAKAHDASASLPLANPVRRHSSTTARTPTSLERVLVNELLSIHRWIGLLPDDEMDPDTAVKMAETTGFALDKLAPNDRETFIRAAEMLSESQGWEQGSVEEALAAFGLTSPEGRSEAIASPPDALVSPDERVTLRDAD